jgi:hypothetical protein
MNIKLAIHVMPWDIDYALLMFTQLKKSQYHLPEDVKITIDAELNLSSYIINWEESKLPKEYFIEKYNTLLLLLDGYNVVTNVYDGDELYGHLDQQRRIVSPEVDYYMNICPDVYFSEYTLAYLIESAKHIEDKYFIINPQHRKLTDDTWNPTTDPDYVNTPFENCNNISIFDIRNNTKTKQPEVYLTPVEKIKFAGWCDLYSKAFYEDLVPIHDDWHGYGPWDLYCMLIMHFSKQLGVKSSQYLLRGQTIGDYWTGPLHPLEGLSGYNKKFIVRNEIPSQRLEFEGKMLSYAEKGLQMLKQKGII